MAFNVETFRATIVNDGARRSMFEVFMNLPPILGGGAIQDNVRFRIRATALPADGVSSIDVPYFGRSVKIAGTRSFPDWSFTIINDEDFVARRNLELWLDLINSHQGNLRDPDAVSAASYQSDAWIIQYGKAGNIIKQYQMIGCFPTDVAGIDLDWASGDQIEEYGVTFAYQYWLSDTTDVPAQVIQ